MGRGGGKQSGTMRGKGLNRRAGGGGGPIRSDRLKS